MSKLDPKFQAKLQELVESGLGPDEIIQHFREEDERKAVEAQEGAAVFQDEPIPDEIRVIAQALAYRGLEDGDFKTLYILINAAYSAESNGGCESFRSGECISKDTLQSLMSDKEYRWLIVEAPGKTNGGGQSLILGAACYSTSGKSKKNGIVEGNLGSIRFFCVDPTFQRLYVGKRMLYRLERALRSEGCVRAMFSIPSPRLRLAKWLNYQSYDRIGGMPYPFKYLDHVLTSEDITLDMYAKSLAVEAEAASIDDTAQRKEDRPQQKNMHLPPHWRGVRSTADILGAATVDINVDALMQSQCNDIVRGTESDDGSLDNDSFDIPDVD